jgi:hypothetical protein
VAEVFTNRPGKYVSLKDTVRGFAEILDGKHDELPEQAFYMVGTIEEAVEAAKGEAGRPESPKQDGQKAEGQKAEGQKAETKKQEPAKKTG